MQIVSYLPKDRQTLLFSATMPPKIQMLASKIRCQSGGSEAGRLQACRQDRADCIFCL